MKNPTSHYYCKTCQNSSLDPSETLSETSSNIRDDALDSNDDLEEKHPICPTCRLCATNETVECLACENWYHISCTGIFPQEDIHSQRDTYVCSSCTLVGLTAAAGTHLDSLCNADQSSIPQEGPSSPKANPTPTPVMVSKSTQHNTPHVADEENATPLLSSQNPECKTCKDRGKQIQKLKEEVKRKSASIETVLNENEKLAQELAQAKNEAQLAEVQNQRTRNILEQKQMDLAQANFTKTQYELDFKHTVAHYDELYSL